MGPPSPKLDNRKSSIMKELLPYLSRINTKDYFEHKDGSPHEIRNARRWARSVLRSNSFDYLMGTIIVANLFVMIIETDQSVTEEDESSSSSMKWTEVFGWTALAIFVGELLLRLFVYRYSFWKDAWSVFDFIIVATDVAFSVIGLVAGNLFPVSILRIFRLAKLARVSKVLRVFPELRLLMAGLMSSISAIFWGTLLLFFCLLVWSMVAVLFIHPLNKDIHYDDCDRCSRAYSSVMHATLTFWQQIVTGDSWGQVTVPLIERYPGTAVFFVLVFLSIGMAVMNLILGVVVNVAQQATIDLQEEDNTEKALFKLEQQTHLLELCKQMDTTKSGELNHDEIFAGFEEPGEFRDLILSLDITREDFDIVWTILDTEKKGSVSYKELVSHLCTMQSSDTQFMLAYIKYYITLIRNTLLENHTEAMRIERKVAREITKIEKTEEILVEDLAGPKRKTLRSLTNCKPPNHKQEEDQILQGAEGLKIAQECQEVPRDPEDTLERLAEPEHRKGDERISQPRVISNSSLSQNSHSTFAFTDQPCDYATLDFVTAAALNEEMQSWFEGVSVDIERWRAELESRLMNSDLRLRSQLSNSAAPDKVKVTAKAQLESSVINGESLACSLLPSCNNSVLPKALGTAKQTESFDSQKLGSLMSVKPMCQESSTDMITI